MRETLAISLLLTGALLAGGCATKKYVQQTADPIQKKVDQVADQANKEGSEIDVAKKDIERHETGINAAKERAMSAEAKANEAMAKATEAGQAGADARTAADKNGVELSSLRNSVNTSLGNLDDYKLQAETAIPFGLNKGVLSPEAKEQLDQFVKEHAGFKRYFISVEGFTDKTGAASYNDALSRNRADRVMAYLVTQHDIPVYRIQIVGLASEKPVDTGRNRAARAKNRRVEVRLFSADQSLKLAQGQ
jgi:outer membrane protein OmpA-like peptidoglycan-associated protein